MGGKGRLFRTILRWMSLACACMNVSCITEDRSTETGTSAHVMIHLAEHDISFKGQAEDMIENVSLLVFNDDGLAERCIYKEDSSSEIEVDLLLGRTYSFYALANFGHQVSADHISEMDELTYHLEDPMEAGAKDILCGCIKDVTITEAMSVTIDLKRLTAWLSIEMDRSRLADDIELEVRSVSIGNCPKQVRVFEDNKVVSEDECWGKGYSLIGPEVSALNVENDSGRSGKVSLFMLENMQGDISDMKMDSDRDKVFKEWDQRSRTCSYIEIQMDYLSHRHFSSEGPLIYRFYLGDGLSNLDVERNCHYSITICPEDDGLSEDSWRVDKTNIHEFGPAGFASFPESYIRGDIGDTLHLYCEFYPPYAPFEIDMEELEYDRKNGVYDYIIDEDGHGVRLILTGPGTGIVYMEAGEPVNEAAMWVVEVNGDTSLYMSPCRTSADPEFRQRPGVRLHRRLQGRGLSPSPPHG